MKRWLYSFFFRFCVLAAFFSIQVLLFTSGGSRSEEHPGTRKREFKIQSSGFSVKNANPLRHDLTISFANCMFKKGFSFLKNVSMINSQLINYCKECFYFTFLLGAFANWLIDSQVTTNGHYTL